LPYRVYNNTIHNRYKITIVKLCYH
jgi:hypothetical protein